MGRKTVTKFKTRTDFDTMTNKVWYMPMQMITIEW